MIVLNPNENYIEVEKTKKQTEPSPDSSDEPAEKRERKDEKETKKRRDFYEKYRNPQQERETEQIPIRVSDILLLARRFLEMYLKVVLWSTLKVVIAG